jgi:uncharacterized membrane protein YfhO
MKQTKAGKQKKEVSPIPSRAKSVATTASIPDNSVTIFIEKNAFLITLGLLLFIAFIVFQDFLFQNKIFLYKDIGSDTVNGAYPTLKHTADYIHAVGMPKWSFNYGMGQNIFPFFLMRGPFDVILYIIGKDQLAYFLGDMEFLKVITGGLLFFLYLRTLSLRSFTCIVGSLLFAFSGFMILGGTWYNFSYEACVAALLLLAFEKLYRQNSWILFPVAFALIGISNPFNFYLYGLFIGVYGVFRFISEKGWNTKAFAILFSKVILLGCLGMALSSFLMFSNIQAMLESPRGSGNTGYFNVLSSKPVFAFGDITHNFTAIMRFFSDDLIGTGINFKGWTNYLEAPMFYSGLLSLLVFPLAFQFLNKRRKIIYAIFLSLWILPVIFPYFRLAFWLFTGDYYRAFSFFVSFAILFFALHALDKISNPTRAGSIKLPYLLVSLAILLSVLFYYNSTASDINQAVFNGGLMSLTKALLVIYAALIYLLSKRSFSVYAQIILIILVCFELGYFSSITVNKRSVVSKEEFTGKTGYNDYTVDAVAWLKEHDKSFYRIDKDYSSGYAIHQSINDGMAQDYKGTSAYNSFNQKYYILFLQAIGLSRKAVETDSRWAQGLRGRPITETIGNVKYFLAKQGYRAFIYDSITHFEDVTILKNRFYLPLGFTYQKYVLRSDFDKMSLYQREFTMMKSFFVDDDEKNDYNGLDIFALKDTVTSYPMDMYSSDRQNLMEDSLSITEYGQNFIHGKISLDKKKLLFLSIPFDKGWMAKVDGKKQELKIVDAGMTGLLLDKGNHIIEMEFYPRLVTEGLIVSIVSLLIYGGMIFLSLKKKIKPEMS